MIGTLKRLWSCERGAVAPIVGICAIMLVGAVAVAVDVGRGQVAQSKLQSALDSAGLAAGAVVAQNLDEEDLKPEAWKYLEENFAGETVDATITEDDFDLVLSEDNMLVTLEARASLPTTFMRIFGHDIMHVAARTEITREMTGLEVALVLDVTGSMTGDVSDEDSTEKITALRDAAHSFIDIVFGDNDEVDDLWVGIVPFSQTVNVGTDKTAWLTDYTTRMAYDNCVGPSSHANWTAHTHASGETTPTYCSANGPNVSTRTQPSTLVNDWLDAPDPVAPKIVVPATGWSGPMAPWYFRPSAWGGCIRERYDTGRDVTDDPVATEGFLTFFAPYASNNEWVRLTGTPANRGSYRIDESIDRSPNHGCPLQPITTLTNVKATLNDKIDLLINPRGNTHTNVGAVWGWRLLSPDWRGDWGGAMDSNNLPLDYDEPLSQKVMILMTDGNNTMPGSFATAYGFVDEENLGTDDTSDAADVLDDKLLAVCTAMKEQGIIIYTIGLGDELDATLPLLQSCASTGDYFFDARTSADLSTAFHTIGDALSKLRVSK
ncbi:MAG: VWA domain-containing protein [Rhodospirillales bacterium]|nr:VWA domain-containing protein [Rhodospirillales bacterium]